MGHKGVMIAPEGNGLQIQLRSNFIGRFDFADLSIKKLNFKRH